MTTQIKLFFCREHLKRELWPTHGPKKWPWWKLFAFGPTKLGVRAPSTGYRLWLYSRRGAVYFDLFFRRPAK